MVYYINRVNILKKEPMTVQEVIDLLSSVDNKSLPCFTFCDGNETTYRFQRGEYGITYDSYEDMNENKIPAVYLLVLRCSNEP